MKSAGENVEPFGICAGMKSELFETLEVEKRAIGELRGSHILERRKDGFDPSGVLSLPAVEHFFHGLTLKIFLRSAEVTGNQGKAPYLRVAVDITLTAIGQRANHNVCLVVAEKLGRHGLEGPAIEEVQKEGLDDVITMMPQGDLGDAILFSVTVKEPSPEARTQSAGRLAFGNDPFDDAVGVLLDDMKRDRPFSQVSRKDVGGESGLFLIQVDRDDLKVDRCVELEAQEDIEQGIGVLAPGEANHHLVTGFDHAEVGDGSAGEAPQPLL